MKIANLFRNNKARAVNNTINDDLQDLELSIKKDWSITDSNALFPSEADKFFRNHNPALEVANCKLNEDGKVEPNELYYRRRIKHTAAGNQHNLAQSIEPEQNNANLPLQVADLAPKILPSDDWNAFNIPNRCPLRTELSILFSRLNERTENALSKWKFVPHFDGVATGNNAPPATFVNGRFPDVELVKDTAIPDATRPGAFLHANRVDLGAGMQFIASQKPKRNEIPGFWQAVAQQAVPLIVDLTNTNDGRHDKDWRRYMPTFGNINLNDVCITKQPLERIPLHTST